MKKILFLLFVAFVTISSIAQKASVTKTVAPLCDSVLFHYSAVTNVVSGFATSFNWSRAAVTGIANAANSGVGSSVNEVLSNTTNDNVIVKYAFTISANGCSNTDTVYVTVHPTPFLVKLYHKPSSQKGEKNRWLRLHLEAVKNSSVFPDKQLGQG